MHNVMFTQQLRQMHSSSQGFQSKIAATAFILMAVTIWLFLRGYHGLLGDAQLYAFQALARIHPHLALTYTYRTHRRTSSQFFHRFTPSSLIFWVSKMPLGY